MHVVKPCVLYSITSYLHQQCDSMHQEHLATDSNGFCFLPEGIEGPKTGGVDIMIPSDLSILAICKCRKLFLKLKNDWMLPSLELRFSPLKIGRIPKRKGSSPRHQFSGAMLRLGRGSFSSTTIIE